MPVPGAGARVVGANLPTRGHHLGVRGLLDLASAARELDAMPKVVRTRREAGVGAAIPFGAWMIAMRAAQRN